MLVFGLDCSNKECRHDTINGYRLRIIVMRNKLCHSCGAEGFPITKKDLITGEVEEGWFRCLRRCPNLRSGKAEDWRIGLEPERNDMLMKKQFLDSLLAQMYRLGWDDPEPDRAFTLDHAHDKRHTLSHQFDYRWMELKEEALPRTAVYFRHQLVPGEIMSPENTFQCVFPMEAGAAERSHAREINLTPEQLMWIRTGGGPESVNENGVMKAAPGSKTNIQCHHCGKLLDLRGLNTLTLREVEKGD